MTAHHFFTDPAAMSNGTVVLRGDEARHAARVLRVRVGEPITVADNEGRVVHAVITRVDDVVEAEIRGETRASPARPAITLCQALVKGEKFDDVVEKATEIGVARIVPFAAERSVVRWDDRKRTRAVDRWRSIAHAAAKQSRAPRITAVDDVADDVNAAVRAMPCVLVLHEAERTTRLRDALPSAVPESLGVVVGPEGGLTDGEVGRLVAAGATTVGIGPRILRTETSGLVAASIVAYTYGSLG